MFGLPHRIQPNLSSLPSHPLCLKGLVPASLMVCLLTLAPDPRLPPSPLCSPLLLRLVWSLLSWAFPVGRGAHHGRWWAIFILIQSWGACAPALDPFSHFPISTHQNPLCPPKPVSHQPLTLPTRAGALGRCAWPCHCLGTPQPPRLAEIRAPISPVPCRREGAACGRTAGAEPRSGPTLVHPARQPFAPTPDSRPQLTLVFLQNAILRSCFVSE